MTKRKERPAEKPPLLSDEELRNRVFGKGPHEPRTVSAQMQRDQRNADRINAWINRFSLPAKKGDRSD